jgi:hypothetical protein
MLEFSAPNLESIVGHTKLQEARSVSAMTSSDAPSGCLGVSIAKREEGKPDLVACDKDDLPAFRDVWEPMIRSVVAGSPATLGASDPVGTVLALTWGGKVPLPPASRCVLLSALTAAPTRSQRP